MENIFFLTANVFVPEFMLPEVYTIKMKLGKKKYVVYFQAGAE